MKKREVETLILEILTEYYWNGQEDYPENLKPIEEAILDELLIIGMLPPCTKNKQNGEYCGCMLGMGESHDNRWEGE